MTIKISQLGTLATVQGNVLVPVVSNITGTFTTVQANVQQIGQYITSGALTYGNLIPSANVAYSLGSLTNQWKDLYLSGSTIYLGNTTIKSSNGGITVTPAPLILFNKPIDTTNVVPGNVQIGGLANGAGTMSATLTFLAGDATYHTLSLAYGTDYVINPWYGALGNLQILLTSTYLSSQGWLGSGTVYITETSATSATLSNVGVTTGNIATPTGNLAITGNVSITGNITSPTITALSASIVAANVGMKGYVDFANTVQSGAITSAVTTANVGMIGYVGQQVTTANVGMIGYVGQQVTTANVGMIGYVGQQVTTANVGLKGYVDTQLISANSAITLANTTMKGYVDGQILAANAGVTSANVGMKGYVDNQTYSNVKVSQYLPTYSGNVGGAITIGGNLTVSNVYVPTANNSVGSKGQITYDGSYVYVCIAANTWRRANLAIW
jgi:predicted amino acid-binding ACT domain protein